MAEQSADSDEMLHCRVTIIDGLGNAIIQNYTMPYNINFQGFLDRLQVDTFHPLLKTHDESDYASWAKRLDFLESDKVGITKLESLIEQHKHTDYEKVAEWLWICKDRSGDIGGRFIAGEKDLKAFMALAKSKKLGHGCLMRAAESKFHEITLTLQHLEIEEDRRGQKQCEEAFCELERRQRNPVHTNTSKTIDRHDGTGQHFPSG